MLASELMLFYFFSPMMHDEVLQAVAQVSIFGSGRASRWILGNSAIGGWRLPTGWNPSKQAGGMRRRPPCCLGLPSAMASPVRVSSRSAVLWRGRPRPSYRHCPVLVALTKMPRSCHAYVVLLQSLLAWPATKTVADAGSAQGVTDARGPSRLI